MEDPFYLDLNLAVPEEDPQCLSVMMAEELEDMTICPVVHGLPEHRHLYSGMKITSDAYKALKEGNRRILTDMIRASVMVRLSQAMADFVQEVERLNPTWYGYGPLCRSSPAARARIRWRRHPPRSKTSWQKNQSARSIAFHEPLPEE